MQQAGNSGPVRFDHVTNIVVFVFFFLTSELVMFTQMFCLAFHLLMSTVMPNYFPGL